VPISFDPCDRDPPPALAAQRLRFGLKLLDHEAVKQCQVLEPATIIMLEQVAHDGAAGRFVDINTDELRPFVGYTNRAFGELAANVERLLVGAARERFPDLLLARLVVRHRERH
jgi:hypothetical protein